MQGDFSRGHHPDRKRGRTYRRVLAQEGRLILDSDINALVDAQDHTMRRMSSDFGCSKGSPDLGFLITPGRLQALFENLEAVSVTGGDLDVYRDFSRKYLDRLPSLGLGNSSGAPGTLTLALRAATATGLVLWVRSQGAVSFTAGGEVVNVNSNTFVPRSINPPAGTTEIDLVLDPGEEVWIGLIEEDEDAGAVPRLWSAGGSYYVDGLLVEQDGDGVHPDLLFDPFSAVPGASAFTAPNLSPAAGQRLVAFLEAGERHVSAVEDRGVLEVALGGRDDTTTRTEAAAQVKLVPVSNNLRPEAMRSAICAPTLADGTLQVTTAQAVDADPCALALDGGYSGGDNRLYRFEVHVGGPVVGSLIKWSRHNGSELYRASGATVNGGQIDGLTFPQQTPLGAGDLVEVLNAWIDTTDEAPATLTAGGSFTPPQRRVGTLVRLHSVAGAGGKTFSMSAPDDDSTVVSLTGYGDPNANPDIPFPKVRLWHGLVEPDASPFEQELEDGITIEVDGTFQVRDYWQYEARAQGANDNGPFQTSPHGPERLFAPLALLEYQSAATPLLLLEWLGERFPSLCSITADHVSFDGDRVGSDSDTVQEALEELFERDEGSGCCVHTLFPNGVDDARQIDDLLDEHPGNVQICLKPGIYAFPSTVGVEGRTLTLHGCPDALIDLRAPAAFDVGPGGRLELEDLTIFAGAEVAAAALITVDPEARAVETSSVGLLIAGANEDQAAILLREGGDSQESRPNLRLVESVVMAGWGLAGAVCDSLTMKQTLCLGSRGAVNLQGAGPSLAESRFGAGYGAPPTWSATQVAESGTQLVEDLLAEGSPPSGTAFSVANLTRGTITRCSFLASDVCLAAEFASQVTWKDNRYWCRGGIAIDLRTCRRVTLRGEAILDADIGIRFSEGALGFDIRDCSLELCQTGILVGDAAEPGDGSIFLEGTVRDNRLETRRTGISIGESGAVARGVTLQGNIITASSSQGIVAYGHFNDLGSARIRTIENHVMRADRGIEIFGVGHEVTGNRIQLTGPQVEFGILADETTQAVISGNLIEDGFTGVAESAVAYWVRSGSDGRLTSNVCRTGPNLEPLRVTNHPRLEVTDNHLGYGVAGLSNTDGVHLHGNQFAGALIIDHCHNGSVQDNRIGTVDQAPLTISNASGSWQVEDNRVRGDLQLTPQVTSEGIIRPGLIATTDFTARVTDQPAWQLIDILAAGMVTQATVLEAAAQTTARQAVGAVARSKTPERAASFAVAQEGWADAWTRAMLDDLDLTFAGLLIDSGIGFDDDLVWLAATEVVYQAQVVGNWSDTLQVGFPARDLTAVNSSTIVQVVANRADGLLEVHPYERSLVANNAADDFSFWISAQSTINTDNLEF